MASKINFVPIVSLPFDKFQFVSQRSSNNLYVAKLAPSPIDIVQAAGLFFKPNVITIRNSLPFTGTQGPVIPPITEGQGWPLSL